jgi:signal transduction histidine kinase
VQLEIEDHGPGIPATNRSQLFQPFFTTKADVGTGLGLWVTKNLIEKNNGSIDLETNTKPGVSGARFIVHLAGCKLAPVEVATGD